MKSVTRGESSKQGSQHQMQQQQPPQQLRGKSKSRPGATEQRDPKQPRLSSATSNKGMQASITGPPLPSHHYLPRLPVTSSSATSTFNNYYSSTSSSNSNMVHPSAVGFPPSSTFLPPFPSHPHSHHHYHPQQQPGPSSVMESLHRVAAQQHGGMMKYEDATSSGATRLLPGVNDIYGAQSNSTNAFHPQSNYASVVPTTEGHPQQQYVQHPHHMHHSSAASGSSRYHQQLPTPAGIAQQQQHLPSVAAGPGNYPYQHYYSDLIQRQQQQHQPPPYGHYQQQQQQQAGYGQASSRIQQPLPQKQIFAAGPNSTSRDPNYDRYVHDLAVKKEELERENMILRKDNEVGEATLNLLIRQCHDLALQIMYKRQKDEQVSSEYGYVTPHDEVDEATILTMANYIPEHFFSTSTSTAAKPTPIYPPVMTIENLLGSNFTRPETSPIETSTTTATTASTSDEQQQQHSEPMQQPRQPQPQYPQQQQQQQRRGSISSHINSPNDSSSGSPSAPSGGIDSPQQEQQQQQHQEQRNTPSLPPISSITMDSVQQHQQQQHRQQKESPPPASNISTTSKPLATTPTKEHLDNPAAAETAPSPPPSEGGSTVSSTSAPPTTTTTTPADVF